MKVLITGGSNGMGLGAAKALAKADGGAHEVIILCRSEPRGRAAVEEIKKYSGNDKVSIILCDLARLHDVKDAVSAINAGHKYLDAVFINAGLGYAPGPGQTADGMDPHFQVNYLSQFMLTLNLLDLLEKSAQGGRLVFNVTKGGEINWDDMQMENNWHYERGVHQAMAAKKILYTKLHNAYKNGRKSRLSFFGYEIEKTVWSNQISIIPAPMRFMARVMKLFGGFISIEKCGEIMLPLFTEKQDESLKKSGRFLGSKNGAFHEVKDDKTNTDENQQERLWKVSLALCKDKDTSGIANRLQQVIV
jgi:hypothetical protein